MFKFNNNRLRHGIGGALQDIGTALGLPPIRGKWHVVDPLLQIDDSYAGLKEAYDACTTNVGDGILILSGDTTTTANTTSYIDSNLAWSKNSITVVGDVAESYFGRARVSSRSRTTGSISTISFTADHTISDSAGGFLTAGFEAGDVIYVDSTSNTNDGTFTISSVTATTITTTSGSSHVSTEVAGAEGAGATTIISYCAPMITISGQNNRFYNLHFNNGGAITAALGGISIEANRNYFKNCHIIGASNATAAAVATTQYDVQIAASEIVFDDCYFGTNSTAYEAANGHIKLGKSTTAIGQVFFNRCKVLSNSSTVGHAAVFVTDAATLNGWVQFDGCSFVNWQPGAITTLTTAIVYAAAPNNTGILISPTCSMVGWAAWSANNDKFVTCGAVGANGTGGIGNTIA